MVIDKQTYDLDQIRDLEKRKRMCKGFFLYSSIKTTKEQASRKWYVAKKGFEEKSFHPAAFKKILILLVTGFLSYWWYMLFTIVPIKPISFVVGLPLFSLVVYLLWDTFFNSSKNYRIKVDFSGITIGKQFFIWSSIHQTAILQLGFGNNERDYLILIFSDSSYQKFSLSAFVSFWKFKYVIAAEIEYFKKGADN